MRQGGLSKKAQKVQEDSRCKGIQGITSKEDIKWALYRIWCGVNRLGDSGVKVV